MSVALPTEYLLLDLEVSSGGEIYDIGVVRGEESVNYQVGQRLILMLWLNLESVLRPWWGII